MLAAQVLKELAKAGGDCRIGLAYELAGELRYAGYYYQRAARDSGPDASKRLTAILGQTRHATKSGRYSAALELLCEHHLIVSDTDDFPEALRVQINVQLAQILQQKAAEQFDSELTVLERPVFEHVDVNAAETLSILGIVTK